PTVDSPSWRPIDPASWSAGRGASYDRPAEGAGPAAFVLTSPDEAAGAVGCYQWVSMTPVREGAVMVLRYRARAEEGTSRLYVGPHLPLTLPAGETSRLAARLRR